MAWANGLNHEATKVTKKCKLRQALWQGHPGLRAFVVRSYFNPLQAMEPLGISHVTSVVDCHPAKSRVHVEPDPPP